MTQLCDGNPQVCTGFLELPGRDGGTVCWHGILAYPDRNDHIVDLDISLLDDPRAPTFLKDYDLISCLVLSAYAGRH